MCIVFDAGIDLENCLVQFTEMLKKIEKHRLCGIQMSCCDGNNGQALGGSAIFFDSSDYLLQ